MMKNIAYYVNLGNVESDRYRVFNIIEALVKRGICCNLLSLLSTRDEVKNAVKNADIFVFFRCEMNAKVRYVLDECRKNNVPTIFDVDDLIFDAGIEQLDNSDKQLRAINIKKTLDECDFFTGSTATLQEFAEKYNKKAFIIPNTINYNQYNLAQNLNSGKKTEKNTIKIGYFSGSRTHQKDFEICENAIIETLKNYSNVELHVVGHLELSDELKIYENKVVKHPYMNYLKMLEFMSGIDINIAPLESSVFNDAKSELKIFEAGLVRVPTIASPTKSYKAIITEGVSGYTAQSSNEWEEKLSLLIESSDLRADLGRGAYVKAISRFYIDNCAENIINIYEEISNGKTPVSYPVEYCYKQLCENLNLEYSNSELDNLEFLSLLYPEGSSFTGFNIILAKYMKTPAFKVKVSEFICKFKDKKICFWGAGVFFEEILSCSDFTGLNILGIIDKNPNAPKILKGYQVYTPAELGELQPDMIIITALMSSIVEPSVREYVKLNQINPDITSIIELLFAVY